LEGFVRIPVRSETDAFWFVVVSAVVIGIALLVGYLAAPVVGVAVFAVIVLLALIWDLALGEPRSGLREAEAVGHRDGVHRGRLVLVVASATPAADQLVRELIRPGTPVPVIEVLAPVLQSKTHFVTTDIDRETAAARQRLAEILASARRSGFKASGEIGDPIDPIAAVADELRSHDVDEVLVTVHERDRANWVENTIIDELRDQLRVPLRELVIDPQLASSPG
jgi:hypothetical protein